ncbi:hypothetical protein V6238_19550, partial [Marinomonas arenicola]|uniref:hypothetical protein n=1 Tax=Marinomonas arenicola TaxID=569601 RepID=UPI00311EE9C7
DSAVDGVTNDGLVNIVLAQDAVSWQYSLDAGVSWQDGIDTSFVLPEGIAFTDYDVQIKQFDLAGNASHVASLPSVTFDESVDARFADVT